MDEAIEVYRKGIELGGRYYGGKTEPTLWFNPSQALLGTQRFALQDVYAAVLADAGQISEAVTVASSALRLAREQHDDQLASAIAGRMQIYAMGHPYRDPR